MQKGYFFDNIMNNKSSNFSLEFDKCWTRTLDEIDSVQKKANQLMIGNRLRPKLVAWGYCFNSDPKQSIDFSKIVDVAVGIELIHKSSIIIDDYLDGDTLRNGLPSFHCEFSVNETILFGLHLLGLATKKIYDNTMSMKGEDLSLIRSNILLFADTICQMTLGGIREITMNANDFSSIDKVQDIISLETVSIIKNSLLIGYLNSKDCNKAHEILFHKIGDQCGYIFQVLNDLEPFSSNNKIINHKGKLNIDITQSRKNIVFSYIYNISSYDDKNKVINIDCPSKLKDYLNMLYIKYDIKNMILSDLKLIEKNILLDIDQLSPYSKQWKEEFQQFVEGMIKYCINKIDCTLS